MTGCFTGQFVETTQTFFPTPLGLVIMIMMIYSGKIAESDDKHQ